MVGSAGERTIRFGEPTAGGAPSLNATAASGLVRVTVAIFGGDSSTEATALEPALAAVLAEIAPQQG